MALSIVVNGGGTFSASMEEGPVSFSASLAAVGPAGPGVAAGGTTGQILVKTTNADYATGWIDNAARSVFVSARNNTGVTIAKGAVVYLSGATGNKATIALAQADSEATSARTIGITKAEIANNADGDVIISGAIENIDTSAFTAGQVVYLSASVAGGLTTTLPTQPNHGVVIGIITRSNANLGSIEVTVQNYQELSELSDVLIASKANLDLLSWDSATSVWKNKSFATLGLLTSATASSTYQTIAGMSDYLTTAAASSDYLSKAGNLSGLASASTSRTNLGLGTMAVETASDYLSKAGNLSGLASASTARTNLGLGTMATETAANYALLNSPTFSGTPTLPTGTIAVTQAAGNSTTAVATTAFVQQEVPAASTTAAGKVELATDAEAVAGTSATLAVTPKGLNESLNDPSLHRLITASGTSAATNGASSGTDAGQFGLYCISGSASGGYGIRRFPSTAASPLTTVGNSYGVVSFSNRITLSGRFMVGGPNNVSHANATVRYTMGKSFTAVAGDLAARGFGIKWAFGSAMSITVHNGTTLVDEPTSFTPSAGECFEAVLVSDGSGNVTCFVNGSQVGTTSAGPTGNSAQYTASVFLEIENTGTPSGNPGIGFSGGWMKIHN